MKATFNISLIFLLVFQLKLIAQTNSNKLPVPSKTFLESVKFSEDSEIKYFKKYIGESSKPKVIKRYTESKEACKIIYSFNSGIIFTKDQCSEVGANVTITFPKYKKEELIKYIEWFFYSEWNAWNKNKSLYEPKEEGEAGCYIQIKQNKKGYFIEYYCGC
jgi:hypothetical protein